MSKHGFHLLIFLDSGLRRNDEKNNAFPIFVSPAKLVPEGLNPGAGVQFKVSKRKAPPTNDVETIMDPLITNQEVDLVILIARKMFISGG